jgi:hypothetical protein
MAIKPIIEGVPMIHTTTQPDPRIFVRIILFINNINSASLSHQRMNLWTLSYVVC